MSGRAPLTTSSDPRKDIPAHPGARLGRIEAAVSTLRAELSRLERLGLGPAVRRCRQQLRYWEFLRALYSLEPARGTRGGRA